MCNKSVDSLSVLCNNVCTVKCCGYRLLQSAKVAASEFGFTRATSANEADGANVEENGNDDGAVDEEDEDDDEKVERDVDYEGDEDDKADLSDSAESGVQCCVISVRLSAADI